MFVQKLKPEIGRHLKENETYLIIFEEKLNRNNIISSFI